MFALERSSDGGPDPSFSRFSNMMNPFSVGLGSLQILAGDVFLLCCMEIVWGM